MASVRRDYFQILGVSKDVSDEELKKAYKKQAMLHHPDRHVGDSEESKKMEEEKFKDVSEAYSVLSDPWKRKQYDLGRDIGHINDFDARMLFRNIFGVFPPGRKKFTFTFD